MQLNYFLSDKTEWILNKNNIAKFIAPIILHREHIKSQLLSQVISTSTNAIYCTENYIVKIFAPEVCGYNPICDLNREVYALELMETTKIRAPHLIAHGLLEHDYRFYYCIIEHIQIPPVRQFILSCSRNEMIKLGYELRKILEIFQSLTIDRPELSKTTKLYKDSIFVHSDLTGDNVLYDGKTIAVIDYEDWHFAPPYTELPAIVFEMIHEHLEIAPLLLNIPYTELKDKLYFGINTHYRPSRFMEKYTHLFK